MNVDLKSSNLYCLQIQYFYIILLIVEVHYKCIFNTIKYTCFSK